MYRIGYPDRSMLPEILKVYEKAREFMAASGNPNQWGTNYPPRELVRYDLLMGNLFTVEDENFTVRGVFSLFLEADPTYGYIEEGSWLSEEPYCTIHRVASDGSGGIFQVILEFARSRNPHIRIDTHRDNHVMQHVLEKHGFSRRGIIYLEDGDPRIAYERV